MSPISPTELRGACPHCGQHFACDPAAARQPLRCPTCEREFLVPNAPASQSPAKTIPAPELPRQFRCPRCGSQIGLFEERRNPTECPRCGWRQEPGPENPDVPATPARRILIAIALFVIGVASPVLVMIGMAVTVVTGPLALLLAPVLGLLCGYGVCRVVYEQAGPRWFWYYIGCGLVAPLGMFLWAEHPHPGAGFSDGAALATTAGMGVATLLMVGGVVVWLLAGTYIWFRARSTQ